MKHNLKSYEPAVPTTKVTCSCGLCFEHSDPYAALKMLKNHKKASK